MMKFLLVVACIAYSLISYSQAPKIKKPGLTVGFSGFYANPQNDFKNLYKGGLGGEIKAGIGLGKTYIVASTGYSAFAAESQNEAGMLTAKPIKIGVKQYFLAKRLFINGDLGVVHLKDKSMQESEKRFTRDIGIGARLLGLEASVFYDTWDNLRGEEGSTNSVVFKLGYNITL